MAQDTNTAASNAEFPASEHEAREHIRQIRRDKGLGDGPDQIGNNASDLESALQVLSHDLYQTSTHFLLELIQNADDNSYDTDTPTLSISYSPGKVRIDCNERGFNKSNIEAICRICKSTKSGRSKSAGFVGEKGIGFKAVFKVASVVWISSGHYSFKFNRDGHLGMIAPIWEKFPETPGAGTSILLQLAKGTDEAGIVRELGALNEKILLFLRRLRKLAISVKASGILDLRTKPFETVLVRLPSETQSSSVQLTNNGVNKYFFVWRHMATGMPKDPRRLNISSSEIVLAFPYSLPDRSGTLKRRAVPIKTEQDVYAFLPIRNFGFPFLLQADFLLSANREDVHSDSPWNLALRSAAVAAVVGAAKAIGSSPTNPLRYSWLAFVPVDTSQNAFFETMRTDMMNNLSKAPILESYAGNMRKPANLTRVRRDLRDDRGRPFTMEKSSENKFLSGSYDPDVYDIPLTYLGTKSQMAVDLHVDMTKMLGSKPANFLNKQSEAWHDSLALALMGSGNYTNLQGLPIIPLRDGRWVARKDHDRVYMADPDTEATVPDGISILMVDTEGVSKARRDLFEQHMGVQMLGVKQIKDAILAQHADVKFKPDSLKPEVLVSHVTYFFENRHDATQAPRDLWLATEKGRCMKGDAVYWPSDAPGSASRVLPYNGNQAYGFIHLTYLRYRGPPSQDGTLYQFVEEYLKVQKYTRLFINESWQWTVHHDFKVLMSSSEQNLWLVVLKDGWIPHYRLKYDGKTAVHLKKHPVRCLDGSVTNPVENSWAPLDEMVKPFGDLVPFLDIPDPTDDRWPPILRGMGVGLAPKLDFYLMALNTAKTRKPAPEDKIRDILHLIDGLPARDFDVGKIRRAFSEQRLIYVPPQAKGGEGRWVSPAKCYWRGESWLTQSVRLDKIYPDLEMFFRTHLGVEALPGVSQYIWEAETIKFLPEPVPLARVQKVLLALSKTAKTWGFSAVQKEALKGLDIFPIVTSTENEPYEYLTSADSKTPWLIADRAHFRKCFQLVVPMLAFSPEFVLKISRLLTELGLKDRFMNDLASSVTEAHGDVKLNKELTQKYQGRAKYLIRLMPEGQENHHQLAASFRRVEVYTAERIMQHWKTPLGLKQVHSQLAEGSAFLECDYAGDLRLYLRKDHENEVFPLEMAEQIRRYLGINPENRDLLIAALSVSEERIDELFDSRGIAPLVEQDIPDDEAENESSEEATAFNPVARPVPTKKKSSRFGATARFTRLFGPTRFSPSFFKQGNASTNSLPSYNAAVARSTQNAIGRPAEPRTFSNALTLPSLKGALKDLDFVQTGATVVGTPTNPITLFDRIRGLTQRDRDIGEMIVSDILAAVLGPQYDKDRMWAAQDKRTNATATFNFTDTQGRFGAFLMRLDGMPGRAQGYTRLIYHLEVKATTKDYFKITQDELDRARENSVHSQPDPDEAAPSKHVSVLVHIADVRTEPKIRFLADPWDLFDDGQLILENTRTYHARLNLRLRQAAARPQSDEAGFDTVQFKQPEDPAEEDPSPDYEAKGGKEKDSKRPEMREMNGGLSAGARASVIPGSNSSSSAA